MGYHHPMRALPCLFPILLLACGSQSLVDRAREAGMVGGGGAPVSAAPNSGAPAPEPDTVTGTPDAAIFKGCAGRRVDAGNEFIGCERFMASVHRPVGYTAEAALDTMVQDVKHGGYGAKDTRTVAEAPYRFALDDRVLTGRRYTVDHAAGGTDHHLAVVLASPSGKLLIAHCEANAQLKQDAAALDDVCPGAMATILTGQVPANIYLAKAPYADGTVVGREVKVPAGCQREKNETQRIRCGEGGQLSWYQARTSLVPLQVVARAKTEAITSSAKAGHVSVTEPAAIECTIEGVKTTCVHYRLDIEGEPAVHFYQGKVDVRGDTLYAMCSGAGASPKKRPPKPCDQVFGW